MLWAQSTTKDYIRAEHKLHSISKSFISQVIIPQDMFFEPTHIPRALNTGTCIRQGDLFYSAGLHRNHVLATANTGEIGRGFGERKCRWMDGKRKKKKKYIYKHKHIYLYIKRWYLPTVSARQVVSLKRPLSLTVVNKFPSPSRSLPWGFLNAALDKLPDSLTIPRAWKIFDSELINSFYPSSNLPLLSFFVCVCFFCCCLDAILFATILRRVCYQRSKQQACKDTSVPRISPYY